MKNKRPVGAPKKEKVLVTKCFRVDEEAYNKAKEIYGNTISKKVNQLIIRLSKRT